MLRSFYPRVTFEGEAGAGAGGAGGTPAALWYDGADAETVGYLTSRGLDKDAKAAAFAAIKSHREAEKMLGVPQSELVRLPKLPNDPAWDSVYQRLGAPKEAAEYKFDGVKKADGNPPDAAFLDSVRALAFQMKVPLAKAADLAQAMLKTDEAKAAATTNDQLYKLKEEQAALDRSWGPNKAANLVVAKNAAMALGIKPEVIATLDNVLGHAQVMEMLRNIGVRIGEDKFIRNDGGGHTGPKTKEEIQARLSEIKSDKLWQKRWRDGGVDEAREMKALTEMLHA